MKINYLFQPLLWAITLLIPVLGWAQQAGQLDRSFNYGRGANYQFNYGYGVNRGSVNTSASQPDGKMIIGGDFTSYNGSTRNGIIRLNSDGSLDPSFNPGTGIYSGTGAYLNTITIQPDGKILIGGYFSSYNGTAKSFLARLNTNGSLDSTFNPSGTGPNASISKIILQPDGKILMCGAFTSYNGITINRIARLNADGSLDASFNPGTGINNNVKTIAIQADGKILIGGFFFRFNGTFSKDYIARLNSDGSQDLSFNIPYITFVQTVGPVYDNSGVYTIEIQNNGKIVIGGFFSDISGFTRHSIARLNSDGRLDESFYPGVGANENNESVVNSISLQPDGKILIGGSFTNTTDYSSYSTIAIRLAQLNSDGSLDNSFIPGSGPDGTLYSVTLQPDGKILISGNFSSYNSIGRKSIARLYGNGSLDANFNPGTGSNGYVNTSVLQSDGKIIIAGSFTTINGVSRRYIARINVDGSLDSTFNPGSGPFGGGIMATALLPDGKIIIVGDFNAYNGISRNRIARLNSDGSLDDSFIPGSGANSWIYATSVQSDGKIIVAGNFSTYRGRSKNKIARLNADGSLDASFNLGTGANNQIRTCNLLADGKILIGGDFSSYNGTEINRIARLNSDGSLDNTFNPGTGANASIYSMTFEDNGKIIIAGTFRSYNGISRKCIARLNSNGALDTTFNPGIGINGNAPYLSKTAFQTNGKIIIVGSFSSFNGTERNNIA